MSIDKKIVVMEFTEIMKKKFMERMDAKDYDGAARILVWYAFCKQDPEELAKFLIEKVTEYRKMKEKSHERQV